VYTVDGSPILVKDSSGNRLLVFGMRRGGRAYYAINVTDTDPDNWTVAWRVSNLTTGMEELGLTFSTPQEGRIKTGTATDVDGVTSDTYKSFLVIPGGYASNEDKSTAEDDYDLTSTHNSNMGRAIYLLDTDTGLPLSSTYLNTDVAMPVGQSQFVAPDATWVATNSTELLAQMRFCFAADPTIILDSYGYFKVAYVSDLYGQVWKLAYELDESVSPAAYKFNLYLIFKANPRSDQPSAYENRANFLGWSPGDADPRGTIGLEVDNMGFGGVSNPRKTFFSPDVSFAGNCYTDVPVLYLGTGDREHPTFIGSSLGGNERVHNTLYGFYDAQAYSKIVLKQSSYANPTSNDPTDSGFLNGCYSEKDLLNVTCGAMEPDMTVFANATDNNNVKSDILSFLATESKGYYTRISEFGGCPDEGDNAEHYGEKAISPVTIFAKKVFAPTYQPVLPTANNDPCIYDGVARLWAVDYCTGNAVYNFYTGNDTTITDPSTGATSTEAAYKRRDRYLDIGSHIPSGLSIIIREGDATGFISVGGLLKSPADIDLPLGMLPLYWREVYDVD
jgi:type IV pilus assembly protein PilY1